MAYSKILSIFKKIPHADFRLHSVYFYMRMVTTCWSSLFLAPYIGHPYYEIAILTNIKWEDASENYN